MVYRILLYLHKLINMKEQKHPNLRNCWYDEIMNDSIELNKQYSEKQISDLSRKDWRKNSKKQNHKEDRVES